MSFAFMYKAYTMNVTQDIVDSGIFHSSLRVRKSNGNYKKKT